MIRLAAVAVVALASLAPQDPAEELRKLEVEREQLAKKLAVVDARIAELRANPVTANERAAIAALRVLTVAEADFRSNDRDGDLMNNYWVGDLNALYALCPSTNGQDPEPKPTHDKSIRLIPAELAAADCAPIKVPGLASIAAAPKAYKGYLFRAIKTDENGMPYDQPVGGMGAGHNFGKFAFVAIPALPGTSGVRTFMVSEDSVVWAKDTQAALPAAFLLEPAKAGWASVP